MVPNPWIALTARPDVLLIRAAIEEPGRYYHGDHAIVLRAGLSLVEERRYLWHEIVHSDRSDEACQNSAEVERSVDREAAQRAMPFTSMLWAAERSQSWAEFADHLKVPEEFARLRWRTAHPIERGNLAMVMREALLSA